MAVPRNRRVFVELVARGRAAARSVPGNRYRIFFSIVIPGCLLDLATKSWVFHWLGMPGERPTWWVWPEVFGFQTNLNDGALFGMGQGMVALFVALSIVAAVAILVWLFIAGAARDRLLTVALALVSAGVCGNLYDRLGLSGLKRVFADGVHQVGDPVYAVRDWILVMIGRWPWPTFNIADSLLVCGAILLGWHAIWHGERKTAAGDGGG